jgi:hypothetical protein
VVKKEETKSTRAAALRLRDEGGGNKPEAWWVEGKDGKFVTTRKMLSMSHYLYLPYQVHLVLLPLLLAHTCGEIVLK